MVSIFVEGKEEVFIKALLIDLGYTNIDDKVEFVSTNGWKGLKKVDQTFKDNDFSGTKNLVIYDADTELNNGGFQTRKGEIEGILNGFNVQYEIFLFPNNGDNGDYESLLLEIINPDNSELLDCFEGYEDCISDCKNVDGSDKYISPNRKSKIYSYISAFHKSRRQKEKMKNKGDWSFNNATFWDLNAQYLTNLKAFLLANIQK